MCLGNDVSQFAAERIGIIEQGVAKSKTSRESVDEETDFVAFEANCVRLLRL